MVVADSGELSQQKDGSQVVTLNKGTRFEGTAMLRDFRITDFNNYQAIIGHRAVSADPDDTEQMDMRTLWKTHTDRARAELHWRFTLVATVFIMALMVVPLSVVNPRQGRVLSMLPAMLLWCSSCCKRRLSRTAAKAKWTRLSGCGRLTCSILRWRCC